MHSPIPPNPHYCDDDDDDDDAADTIVQLMINDTSFIKAKDLKESSKHPNKTATTIAPLHFLTLYVLKIRHHSSTNWPAGVIG
jgi:hypothetical protein